MRFALLTALLLLAQDSPDAEAVRLLRQLGDDDVAVRQLAQARLMELGPAIRPALERGRAAAEPEARLRLGEILRAFDWADAFPTLAWKDLRAAVAGAAPATEEAWRQAEGVLRGPLLDDRANVPVARACFERLLESGPARWAPSAIRALAVIGDARSAPALLAAMGREHLREDALRALRLVADDTTVPLLLAAMRKADDAHLLHSVLARAATPVSGRAVSEALKALDPGHSSRPLLGNLLGRIGGAEAFDAMSGQPPEEAHDLWANAWVAVLARQAAANPDSVRKLLRENLEATDDPVIDVALRSALAIAEPASVGEVVGHIGRDRRHTLAGVEELLLRGSRVHAAPVARRFLADEDVYLRGLSLKLLAAIDDEADGARVAAALAADRADPDAAALAAAVSGNAALLKEVFRRPPSPDVLFAALGTRGSREWEPKLLAYLEKEELWHAPLAVDFLASWGGPASGEWLAKERPSEPADYFMHIAVAVRLAPKAAIALRRHLDGPDPDRSRAALGVLASVGDAKALEVLLAGLRDPERRADFLEIAARVDGSSPEILKELETLASDGDLRRPALPAVARRAGPARALELSKDLSDLDAARARWGDRAALERLLASDRIGDWHDAAVSGLVPAERMRRRIRWAMIDDPDAPIHVVGILVRHPGFAPSGLAARELRWILHQDLELVEQPPEALHWLEIGAAAGAVEELAAIARHSGFPYVRLRAIQALGSSGNPAAIPVLLEFLEDCTVGSTVAFEHSSYRYYVIADEAARGLEKLTGRKFPGGRPARAAAWRDWHAKNGSRR